MKFIYSLLIIFFSILFFQACTYNSGDVLFKDAVCDTFNMKYVKDIKPVFNDFCISCHNTGNLTGTTLDKYDEAKAAAESGRLETAINYKHASGSPKNMPQSGKLSDCIVQKISAWVHQGSPEN